MARIWTTSKKNLKLSTEIGDRKEQDMKIRFRSIVKESIGWVLTGDIKDVEAQSVEDKGDYYSIMINSNRELRMSKKNWTIDRID